MSIVVIVISLLVVMLITGVQALIHKSRFRAVKIIRCHSALTMSSLAKAEYRITLLPGDGIGPEIIQATLPVLKKVSKKCKFTLHFQEADIGGVAVDRHQDPFPDISLQLCRQSDAVLLAAIGGYKWDNNPRHLRPETGLLKMRKEMDLFANLRPVKVISSLLDASSLKREVIEDVDILVVRELTSGIYFGTPRGIERDAVTGKRRGYSTAAYTEEEIDRIGRVAFTLAQFRQKKKVCSIDKANVLEVSQLWREVMTSLGKDFPAVDLSHMYIDNAAMQLLRDPRQFDIIVCGNMFGDILSDEASMLVGSLGMLPSASLGFAGQPGVFEPCHGSAPDLAGTDQANPLAQILSGAMMLRYGLSQPLAAEEIERAVEKVLEAGYRTRDLLSLEGMKRVGCQEMGQLVTEMIQD